MQEDNKNAYQKYITSPEWYNLKIDLLTVRGCKCERCGKPKPANVLHIHHITYERLFRELASDLLVLCPICHMKEHGLIKQKPPKHHIPKKAKKRKNPVLKVENKYKEGGYKTYDGYLNAKKSARRKLKSYSK